MTTSPAVPGKIHGRLINLPQILKHFEYHANLFTCEYDPARATEDDPGTTYRLRGCFLPQSVSIPTAVQWVLNPLPASACGLGD